MDLWTGDTTIFMHEHEIIHFPTLSEACQIKGFLTHPHKKQTKTTPLKENKTKIRNEKKKKKHIIYSQDG